MTLEFQTRHYTALREWHALHAFSHAGAEELEQILTERLFPRLQDLKEQGQMQGWFFIRYWEGGPHLRVRLLYPAPGVTEEIEALLQSALGEMVSHPLDPVQYYSGFTSDPQGILNQLGWHDHGAVKPFRYDPETERYGGFQGLWVSEDFFQQSSELAVVALKLAPRKSARLGLALRLLLLTLHATRMHNHQAIAWLREFVNAWPIHTPLPVRSIFHTREHAEEQYFQNREQYQDLARLFQHGAAQVHPFMERWHQQVSQTHQQYQHLWDQKQLTLPPLEIWKSQVHMFHNRLGLTIEEESYLGSLASLILSGPSVEALRLEDPLALDRRYHEASKFYAGHLPESLLHPAPHAVRTLPSWPGQVRQSLPEVSLPDHLQFPLGEALMKRTTHYRPFGGDLTLPDVSVLLSATAGVSEERHIQMPHENWHHFRRTYPSGGARYPWKLHVLVGKVQGLNPGHYIYEEHTHELVQVGAFPDRDLLSRCSTFLQPQNPMAIDVEEVPLWIIPVLDFSYIRQHYALRAYRHALLECGHLSQNLCLTATALGLAHNTLGGFWDDAVSQLLRLDSHNQFTVYLMPIGGRAASN